MCLLNAPPHKSAFSTTPSNVKIVPRKAAMLKKDEADEDHRGCSRQVGKVEGPI